jgi:hypothetical protein
MLFPFCNVSKYFLGQKPHVAIVNQGMGFREKQFHEFFKKDRQQFFEQPVVVNAHYCFHLFSLILSNNWIVGQEIIQA